jgi:hypothetical protein
MTNDQRLEAAMELLDRALCLLDDEHGRIYAGTTLHSDIRRFLKPDAAPVDLSALEQSK